MNSNHCNQINRAAKKPKYQLSSLFVSMQVSNSKTAFDSMHVVF